MKTVFEKTITEPQIKFIRSLANDRNWVNLPDGRQIRVIKLAQRTETVPVHELLNNPLWLQLIKINRKFASETIDALKSCPQQSSPSLKGVATQMAPKTSQAVTALITQHSDVTMSTYDQFLMMVQYVPTSKYALVDDEGEWNFYQVKTTIKTGKTWLYKLQGAPGDWVKIYLGAAKEETLNILKAIVKNPWQAAQDYTAEHKECAACGAKLSVGKSIQQGFGPICIKKFQPFM